MPKERLDMILVQRGLSESREQAQRLIRAGQVFSGDRRLEKPGHRHDDSIELTVKGLPRFVSRGGEKLEGAFEEWGLNVDGLTCLDVGASTGGFTDCLLQHGAARVYAVDVGKGQLHWKLRNDDRVDVFEGMNARNMTIDDIPGMVKFAVTDVSFISLKKILPAMASVVEGGGELVTLIKPQFEAGRELVEKGGVIRDPEVRQMVVDSVRTFGIEELGLEFRGVVESPIKGPAGNVEFLAYWAKP